MNNVREQVRKIVVGHLRVDENTLTDSAHFMHDLGADSLDCVELVLAFEDQFDCEIPDDAAEKMSTIYEVIRFIEGACSNNLKVA